MWRGLAASLLVTGCGRLAFDARTDAGSGDSLADGALVPPSGFTTLCDFSWLTAIHDGFAGDDYATDSVQLAINNQCATMQLQRTVMQNDVGILDPTTSAPLLALNDLAVVGGGDGAQRINGYFIMNAAWPIIHTNGATAMTWTDRATNTVLLQAPYSSLTQMHDYGLVVVVRDPPGGSTMVTAWGTGAPGTLAAAYFFVNVIAPTMQADRHSWYVLEWTNNDADVNPTPADTLTVLGSGP